VAVRRPTLQHASGQIGAAIVRFNDQAGDVAYFDLVRTPQVAARFHRMEAPPAFFARPVETPSPNPAGACPQTPIGLRQYGLSYQGGGWFFVANLADVSIHDLPLTHGWYGQKVFWAIDVGDRPAAGAGPILVRVVRLDGDSPVGLGDDNRSMLVLTGEPNGPSTDRYRVYVDGVGLREPGCYEMQIDTATDSETIVFRALP
jgi:hypothetical protein